MTAGIEVPWQTYYPGGSAAAFGRRGGLRATKASPGHEREFIDCVKSREECSTSFARHLPMHLAMNLAHLSLKLGRKLKWDNAKFEVTGDAEATAMLTPDYRAPWKLPTL